MPKPAKNKSELATIRKGLGMSQACFAKRLGISLSLLKKVEQRRMPITQELRARVFAETGHPLGTLRPGEEFTYSKRDLEAWRKELALNEQGARAAARFLVRQIELMLVAAARPNVQQVHLIFNAILLALHSITKDFHLQQHIDAHLRDVGSVEMRRFNVGKLRKDPAHAQSLGFRDRRKYRDQDEVLLEIPVGGLPTRAVFDVLFHEIEFLRAVQANPALAETPEGKARLEQMEAAIGACVDPILPR